MTALEPRRAIAGAVAWTLLAELVRRHADQAWHILELHPGGGQYDLLTLWSASRWDDDPYMGSARQRLSLNLLGSATGDGGECDWFERWVTEPDPVTVVDMLERCAGLPHRPTAKPTSCHVFGIRLIALLLSAHAFDRYPLDARMMWSDTSGDGGGMTESAPQFGITDRRQAMRWWSLSRSPKGEPILLVRVDGRVKSVRSEKVSDLYPKFRRTGNISDVLRGLQIEMAGSSGV